MTPRLQVAQIVDGFEGGFVNHAADRGGATNHGITLATLQDERPGATVEDLRALGREDALELLTARYALRPGFERIQSAPLRFEVIDYAIHSHPFNATKALQWAVGAKVDGRFGPLTEAAVNAADPLKTQCRLSAYRLRLWARIFRKRPDQLVFAAGWLNRIAALLEDV